MDDFGAQLGAVIDKKCNPKARAPGFSRQETKFAGRLQSRPAGAQTIGVNRRPMPWNRRARLLEQVTTAMKKSLSPGSGSADPDCALRLRERLGVHHYRQRMNVEHYHAAEVFGGGRTRFHPENFPILRLILQTVLRASLLYGWGNRNARRHQVRENSVRLRRLPAAFEGYRILQISDLHLDIDPAITTSLVKLLASLEYDLCVVTGDYRFETFGAIDNAMAETQRVMAAIRGPRYGILGNHDALGMTPHLESMGLPILLNEHVVLEHHGAEIYLAGVDDPHYYETEDFERAITGIPPGATTLLLSHSAETYRKALACGIDYMLSGHTHGGQICLPGGFAPLRNAQHPRYMDKGPWCYHELQGYTTTGVGCSMVPVRFFCPPEVVVHTLRSENAP